MSYYPITNAVIKKVVPDKNDVKLHINLPGDTTEYIILNEYENVKGSRDGIGGSRKCYFSKGDLLYCVLQPDPLGQLRFVRLPRVVPGKDRNTLISFFLQFTKDNWNNAQTMFYKLSVWANGENNLYDYLSSMSERYRYFVDRSVDIHLAQMVDCSLKDAGKILNCWYNQKILRELQLLTVTAEEIEKSHLRTQHFKAILLDCPFRICSLTPEKAQKIADCLSINVSNESKTCSHIQKMVYEKINGSGWTSMKLDNLQNKVGILSPEIIKKLEIEYFLHFDDFTKCVYLDFTYKAEVLTADFLLQLKRNDPFDYTNIGSQSFMHNGNYVQSVQPVLSRTDYTSDQIKAITGALNHRFSIITGAAGTGKCLAKGTLLRNGNGQLVKVEDLKIGSKLLGYRGQIRRVLDLGHGYDTLYKIVPNFGNSFVCNGDHLLTVRGLSPAITPIDRSRVLYRYTVRGEERTKTLNADQISFEEDVYEIRVKDYLRRKPKHAYLFHQKINYPARDIKSELTKDCIPEEYIYNEPKVLDQTLKFFFGPRDGDTSRGTVRTREIALTLEYIALSRGYAIIRRNKSLEICYRYSLTSPFQIEELDRGEYFGFTLDGDGRFLLADYTVTHNTTIVREIYENLVRIERTTMICSFMGKAVSRVREVMGNDVNAVTIHSAIIQIKLARAKALKEKSDAFRGPEHIIIDEASTLSADLFAEFIAAFSDVKYLTFVGDVNQLEPIQWGFPMKSIMISKLFPVYYLSTNHRLYNSEGRMNGVAVNALFIAERDDEASDFSFTENEDFITLHGNPGVLIKLLEEFHEIGIPCQEMVVITPYNRYIKNINTFLQSLYNGTSNGLVDKHNNNWRVGDRVMLLQNCDSLKIYNGDEFIISNVKNIERIITVQKKYESGIREFPVHVDATIEYDEEGNINILTTNLFTLSYCITVDKSQGSEYNYVIYYIPMNDDVKDSSFLYRNRSYVAVSRTRKKCYLVGNYVLHHASCMRNSRYRHDNLTLRMEKNRGDLKTVELYVDGGEVDLLEDDFPDDAGLEEYDGD